MKRVPLPFLIALSIAACDDAQPETMPGDGTSTSAGKGDTPSEGGTGSTSGGSTTGADPETAETGASTGSESGAESGGESGGEDEIDPSGLPFGGYISWTQEVDGLDFDGNSPPVITGLFDFFEIADTSGLDLAPDSPFEPLGPSRSEDRWFVYAEEPYVSPDRPEFLDPWAFTDQVSIEAGGTALALEPLEPATPVPTYDMPAFAGGAWSVSIPASDDLPDAVFEDVLPGPAWGDTAIDFAYDGNGVPTHLVWEPIDGAREVSGLMWLTGGGLQLVCSFDLVNDGEAELPAGCAADVVAESPQAVGFGIRAAHELREDVAYGGHRIRISTTINRRLEIPYPF